MNRIRRVFLGCGLGLMSICGLVSFSSAESWWESKQEGTTTDQIAVEPSSVGGKPAWASRTNWEDGYIEVMAGATADTRDTINLGHAYSVALKTARHLAYEKLAETVGGLNLYGDATYDRELMRDANLRTVVRSMIRGARVVDEKKSQFTDGSLWVEVTLGMKLFGEDGLIKPSADVQEKQEVAVAPAPPPTPVAPQPAPAPAPQPMDDQVYTGLIIDASGLGASPAMLPKVLSENGGVIYGTLAVDREYVIKTGLVGYQSDLEKALKMERVGSNPLVVKARAVSGKNKTDFVVADADAQRIAAAAAKKNFLKECRVVAVLK